MKYNNWVPHLAKLKFTSSANRNCTSLYKSLKKKQKKLFSCRKLSNINSLITSVLI